MSRTARIARALTIGYGFQAVVALTGLALTPFLLARLGGTDYGRWLVAAQVLGLLGLLDLGVTAVLPREVARAFGSAGGVGESVSEVVRRAWWLVWVQTPLVGGVAACVWFGAFADNPDLSGPLAVVLTAFVVQFPLRLPGAVLTGLQDLTFSASCSAVGWVATTALSVGLVFAGWGLYALAAGWAVGQIVVCGAAWARLRTKFPGARGKGGWPGRAALAVFLGPSLWTSLRQLAQLLLNGVDLIILGWMAGPAAVVVYACTVKLIAVVNNQPYAITIATLPAATELAAAGGGERLWRAVRAVAQGMLIFSGALAVAVVAVNAAFVSAWVGPDRFAGPEVTLLAISAMLLRHWIFNLGQTMYVLGAERLLTAAAVADGVMTVAATIGWVSLFGYVGVPLGSITGVVLTNAPLAIVWLSRYAGVSPATVLKWAAPWGIRSALVLVVLGVLSFSQFATSMEGGAGLLVAGLTAYLILVRPLLWEEPLAGYTRRVTQTFTRLLGNKKTTS